MTVATAPPCPSFGAEQLLPVLGFRPTDEQLAAITAEPSPVVVIAGAGSGKTSVMAARAVWLVATGAVAAEDVLGLTFTNKAAAELASRIRTYLARLGPLGWPSHPSGDASSATDEPTVLTYDAYAGRLMREHGLRIGVEPSARLMTDARSFQLAERVVRRATGPFRGLRGGVVDVTGKVVALDAQLQEHLVEPSDLRRADAGIIEAIAAVERSTGSITARVRGVRNTATAREELLDLVVGYRAEKSRRELVDFGDQMSIAARIAEESPFVVTAERSRHPVVLLDEYQDTSIAQKRLMVALFGDGHAVTAVGDPFQSIYGWRGASVRNIAAFVDDFGSTGSPASAHGLARNNRSDTRIVEVANAVAEPLRRQLPGTPSLTSRPGGADGEVLVGLFETVDDEVQALADDLEAQLKRGTAPGDVAVLTRLTRDLPAIHAALTSRAIPVEMVGLTDLLSLPEATDLVSMLEVIDDATANASLVRLLTGPRWRIGARDLALLGARARQLVAGHVTRGDDPDRVASALRRAVAGSDPTESVSLADALDDPGSTPFSTAAAQRLQALSEEISRLRAARAEPLVDFVHRVADESGLSVEVHVAEQQKSSSGSDAPSTLDVLFDHIVAFADTDASATLTSLLAWFRAAGSYRRGLASEPAARADTVTLLTVHRAKGLEWPLVYLPAMTASVFPYRRSRALWTTHSEVLPFRLRGDAADLPAEPAFTGNRALEAFTEQARHSDELEECRLAYVAFTRAKNRMVITGHWWGRTGRRSRGPSVFLEQAHLLCAGRAGAVLAWACAPEPSATNPVLKAATQPTPWPAPGEPRAEFARREAASWVREAMQEPGPVTSVLTPAETARAARWDADFALLAAEAHAATAADRVVRLPNALSASQVLQLVRDPDGLAKDLARPMPRAPSSAAGRGSAFHAWVAARFATQPLIDLDDMSAADERPAIDDDASELRRSFLAGPYADRTPVGVEVPFSLVLGGRTIRGRIDAVYVADPTSPDPTGRRFEVVDWKTGHGRADPLQLAIYRLAWAELSGVHVSRVDGAFCHVRTGEVEIVSSLPERAELAEMLGMDANSWTASGT